MQRRRSFTRRFIRATLIAAFLLLSSRSSLASPDLLRVGLLWGADALARAEVSGEGVLGCESGRREFSGRVAVAATAAGLTAELGPGQSVSASVMRFSPAQPGAPLALGERRYRGDLLLSRADEGLRIVNEVELEDYVKGVVPNEMFREEEAFRVQAVVSRTFALYVRDVERRHAADGFDLCDGWCCQVYRGYDSEDPLANQAVDSTRGEVLLYQGKPILAAYDANAGGRTCAVDEAWPGSIRRDFPYLRSLASPDDVAALELKGFESSYRWQVSFPWEQLLARLDLSADKMGEPRPPRLLTGPSGRVVALILRGSRGLHRLDRPEAIRRALGLKSARFRVELDGGLLRFSGLGNGHGVGLSQHGAFGMAKRGLRHAEILRYYYPGAELVEIHSVGRPPEPRLALWKPPAENAEEGKLRP